MEAWFNSPSTFLQDADSIEPLSSIWEQVWLKLPRAETPSVSNLHAPKKANKKATAAIGRNNSFFMFK